MARLVTKFKYLKPDQKKPIGGYATYIATREGVEKIDESFKLASATVKQQKLIEKLLRDFPDSATMLERMASHCPTCFWKAMQQARHRARTVEKRVKTAKLLVPNTPKSVVWKKLCCR